jgi:hypothetical protein
MLYRCREHPIVVECDVNLNEMNNNYLCLFNTYIFVTCIYCFFDNFFAACAAPSINRSTSSSRT